MLSSFRGWSNPASHVASEVRPSRGRWDLRGTVWSLAAAKLGGRLHCEKTGRTRRETGRGNLPDRAMRCSRWTAGCIKEEENELRRIPLRGPLNRPWRLMEQAGNCYRIARRPLSFDLPRVWLQASVPPMVPSVNGVLFKDVHHVPWLEVRPHTGQALPCLPGTWGGDPNGASHLLSVLDFPPRRASLLAGMWRHARTPQCPRNDDSR